MPAPSVCATFTGATAKSKITRPGKRPRPALNRGSNCSRPSIKGTGAPFTICNSWSQARPRRLSLTGSAQADLAAGHDLPGHARLHLELKERLRLANAFRAQVD